MTPNSVAPYATHGRKAKSCRMSVVICCGLFVALSADAQQIDIPGPANSVYFGTDVAALPNGNIVVTDPQAGTANQGAVYLYTPAGSLISTLTGSTAFDQVGSGTPSSNVSAITVLSGGDFVISSPNWSNGAATSAGAVTWINGSTGLSGTVSAANSLVGTHANDFVGGSGSQSFHGVTQLTNGNYVVGIPGWNGQGAAAWASGHGGVTGPVSSGNSLIGAGVVTALTNGNYVVRGGNCGAGSVTWANGSTGLAGTVSVANSLVGTRCSSSFDPGDDVGIVVVALTNGNYVVGSDLWTNGPIFNVGAVTWGNGSTGLSGAVSAANSLIGNQNNDRVGAGITALSNGNYVVNSPSWANGPTVNAGAATWANGSAGLVGKVSTANSLVGTNTNDQVGYGIGPNPGPTALTNGNYVVVSWNWSNGLGAVTWGNGSTGLVGTVSAANSLVGTTAGDMVGRYVGGYASAVTALSNGNYVVASPLWNNFAGAATWADGNAGVSGAVSVANSLVGSNSDEIGYLGATALSNGNYVVGSPFWAGNFGAVTWGNGSTGLAGGVSSANSLVGSASGDLLGSSGGGYLANNVRALANGNYVVASPHWKNGALANAGAATWVNGARGLTGLVSSGNSLIGSTASDQVGSKTAPDFYSGNNVGDGITALSNGDYLVASPLWTNAGASASAAGAVSLARGNCRGLEGTIQATNSVRGTTPNGGNGLVFAYDPTHDQLVVGQKWSNIVSLFKADQLFACGFE